MMTMMDQQIDIQEHNAKHHKPKRGSEMQGEFVNLEGYVGNDGMMG